MERLGIEMINWKKTIGNMLHHYMFITFAVLVVTATYISVFFDDGFRYGVELLWQILTVSFVCSLSEIIFAMPDGKEMSKIQWIIRWVLCYIYVNIVVLSCGLRFGWFAPESLPMVIGMLVCIAAVFLFVYAVVYFKDVKTADQMNQKLLERNQGLEE